MPIYSSSLSPQINHPASLSLWHGSIHFLSSFFSQAAISLLASSQTPPASVLLLLPAQLHCSCADISFMDPPAFTSHALSLCQPYFQDHLLAQLYPSLYFPASSSKNQSVLVPLYSCTAEEQTFGQETTEPWLPCIYPANKGWKEHIKALIPKKRGEQNIEFNSFPNICIYYTEVNVLMSYSPRSLRMFRCQHWYIGCPHYLSCEDTDFLEEQENCYNNKQ